MEQKTTAKKPRSQKSIELSGAKIGQKKHKELAKRRAANKTAAESRKRNRA